MTSDRTFIQRLLLGIPADYSWNDRGIIRIGATQDIAAGTWGDFSGRCLIFCHGNGETAVSERFFFGKLAEAGVSVICPDYRGYGLSGGELSERGCYEAAHAAYSYLLDAKGVRPENVFVLGYSLGSAIAVELVKSVKVRGLILQTPFFSGLDLRRFWDEKKGLTTPKGTIETSFPTASRLASVKVPSLVIHGTADTIVPFSQGEAVFAGIASKEKRMITVEGAGHTNFQFKLGDKYIPMLTDFILAEHPEGRARKPGFLRRLFGVLSSRFNAASRCSKF